MERERARMEEIRRRRLLINTQGSRRWGLGMLNMKLLLMLLMVRRRLDTI
jgi:hypothetical protein